MTNTDIGITIADFQQVMDDLQRTISYQVSSKTTDGMGNETTTFAAASNLLMVFYKNDTRYKFDKEGLTQIGDAYVMAPLTAGIKRYDRLTIDSNVYYIESVVRRYIGDVAMFDYGVLFLVEGAGK